MSEPRLLVKYDYNNQQIKIEPRENILDEELTQIGRDIFHLIKDQRHDEEELNQLDTRLYKLQNAMREVESVIRFLHYGGDQDQKDVRSFNDSFVDTNSDGTGS